MTVPRARLEPSVLAGVFLLHPRRIPDPRGSFCVYSSRRELAAEGIDFAPDIHAQADNRLPGTLRGLHFQRPPHDEAKIVRCVSGRAIDVVVDLRANSSTHGRWTSVELVPEGASLFVPRGFAHGYMTIAPDTRIEYLLEGPYAPGSADGLVWNDPALAITWPFASPTAISSPDQSWPTLAERPVALAASR